MTLPQPPFTPYPDVDALLVELMAGMQTVLGERLLGLYLEGSLASGDFDFASDIDFTAVVRDGGEDDGAPAFPEADFQALQAMHDRLAQLDSPWAIQLEGFYLSPGALRRHDPAGGLWPNLERGEGEHLKLVRLDASWDIHRHVLRERGITLFGPDPRGLIDMVTPDQLRQAMRPMLFDWGARILAEPNLMGERGSQSYIVLTICRVLYTLASGATSSKPAAARWALANLDPRWSGLIENALIGRHNPNSPILPGEISATLHFLRFAQEQY